MIRSALGRSRPPALLLTTLALLAALLAAPGTTAAAEETDPRAVQAQAALAKVESMLAAGKAGIADRHTSSEMTIARRDLFMLSDALTGEDREQAEQIMARPSDNESGPNWEPKYGGDCMLVLCASPEVIAQCSAVLCVHYVDDGSDDATDPAFATKVLKAASHAHRKMRKFGYRSPLPDAGRGGDDKPDIYLANLGKHGVFGYAQPEGTYSSWGWGAFGYVVLDNDYREFCSGGCSATRAAGLMRATAAHEYFHLVQFGYDYAEDSWLLEATATWIEDEIFDGVNDNVNFLYASPTAIQNPSFPLDHQDAVPYGNWIFFRYLSEKFGRKVVLGTWRWADGFTGGGRTPPDRHSIFAVRRAVIGVGGKWNKEFAKFGEANRRPWRYYDEAKAQNYPYAPPKGRFHLAKFKKKKVRNFELSRLANATYRIKPHKSLHKGWKLRVRVEGSPNWRGGYAIATIKHKGGRLQRVNFWLGPDGRKTKTLPFGKANVKWIDVTITNASTRNNCWLAGTKANEDATDPRSLNTCNGVSRDNKRPQKLVARAIRK